MSEYNKDGTARLIWNKQDSRKYVILTNPHEPPEREPIENSYLMGMLQFSTSREFVGVHTFDLSKKKDCAVVDNVIKAIENVQLYYAYVKMNGSGEFESFFISDEKPDTEYATFNIDTLKWDLPDNVVLLRERAELTQKHMAISQELEALDKKLIRPLAEGETERIKEIVASKKPLRDEITRTAARLAELSDEHIQA